MGSRISSESSQRLEVGRVSTQPFDLPDSESEDLDPEEEVVKSDLILDEEDEEEGSDLIEDEELDTE